MYNVTRTLHFCFAHRLLNYEGKCRRLHGHTAKIEVDVESPSLDRQGMVVDVCLLEKKLEGWIDEALDHRLILSEDDPLLPILRERGEPCLAMPGPPTMENLCRFIYERAFELGLNVSRVRLWESENSSASYRPL